MQSTSREALSLDVETFATLLRRLFRTVRPEMTGADWQQRLKQQVLRSQLGRDLHSEAGREAVMRLAAHCSRLLDSMALRAVASSETGKSRVKRICIETQHKYSACTSVCMRVHMPGAHALKVTLDPRCCTKRGRDVLTLFSDSAMKEVVGVPYHGPQVTFPPVRDSTTKKHRKSKDNIFVQRSTTRKHQVRFPRETAPQACTTRKQRKIAQS